MAEISNQTVTEARPARLYSAEQSRQLDRCAIEQHGIPGIVLMKRAGRAAFSVLMSQDLSAQRITIITGGGNNAGDGFIVAGLAAERSLPVEVRMVAGAEKLKGDARRAYDWAIEQGVTMHPFTPQSFGSEGLIVDAMLGTGLSTEVRAEYRAAIDAVNASGLPVLALDIPSGLCSDTGRVLGGAVRATWTVTFIGAKTGLFTAAGPAYCGAIHLFELGVPAAVYRAVDARAELLSDRGIFSSLSPRARDAHKGRFGHVLVVGGDHGMGGAALMAAQAAARCGAGLVSVATREAHLPGFLARCPELMVHAVDSRPDLMPLLKRATVVVVGPGLGSRAWGEGLLQAVLEHDAPLVIDADALNLIAADSGPTGRLDGRQIMTPHPGEAARLLASSTAAVQNDRFAAALGLQGQFGGIVILKGAGSLICGSEHRLALCPDGNPGMASGGMGDVLSGVIAALLAQGHEPYRSACMAVSAHARAADLAAISGGELGLMATDLLGYLRMILNGRAGDD